MTIAEARARLVELGQVGRGYLPAAVVERDPWCVENSDVVSAAARVLSTESSVEVGPTADATSTVNWFPFTFIRFSGDEGVTGGSAPTHVRE